MTYRNINLFAIESYYRDIKLNITTLAEYQQCSSLASWRKKIQGSHWMFALVKLGIESTAKG